MILNPTECRYRCLGENKRHDSFEFENTSPNSNKHDVSLRLAIDIKLSFDSQIKKICG